MFDEPVRNFMRQREALKATPETLVSEAARLMAAKKAGAIMVVEGDRLVGILPNATCFFA
jgi:CBS domain-containing protein